MIVLCIVQYLIGLSLVCRDSQLSKKDRRADNLARRCIAPSMGFLSRRRIPLLQLLPPRQHQDPIPARSHDLRTSCDLPHLRSAVPNQQRRYECLVLALRRQ